MFGRLFSWQSDANASIDIEPDRHDSEDDNFASGLSQCITKDGQTTITQNIPFNNKLITGLGDATAATHALNRKVGDARYLLVSDTETLKATFSTPSPPQGRPSFTSGVAVQSATVSGATTVYFVPHGGRRVPIWDGTKFASTDIGGELSQAATDTTKSPAAVAANKIYDLYVWNDGGTIRCTRSIAWSSDTSRGTGSGTAEQEDLQGLTVNKHAITNGPAAQRGTYVGSVRSNGTAQFDFNRGGALTPGNITLWSAYNRVKGSAVAQETADSWTYTTATWRQMNNSANNQVSILVGHAEEAVTATVRALVSNSSPNVPVAAGIGVNSTSVNSAQLFGRSAGDGTVVVDVYGQYSGVLGAGWNTLAALEYSTASGLTTWWGDAGVAAYQAGLICDFSY